MNYFEYRNGEMFAEGVPLKRIAQEVGTPAYVYSLATLKRHLRVFDEAFAAVPHIVCFSVKANSNIALLQPAQPCGCAEVTRPNDARRLRRLIIALADRRSA